MFCSGLNMLCKEGFFFIYVRSTLLHLPPLRFHCVGDCLDRTQDCCDFGIDTKDALTTRLDLIHRTRLDLIRKHVMYVFML
jgi:hypothetical protein